MRLAVQWGRNPEREVGDVTALDALLDDIAGQRGDADSPYLVNISRVAEDGWLSIGVGEKRSFIFWSAGDGWGGQPEVEPLKEELWFDQGGVPTEFYPEQTRVLPEAAREAAREWARTGQVPDRFEFGDAYSPFG